MNRNYLFDLLLGCNIFSLLHPTLEEREELTEGLLYRQQESHLCQQMKLATVSQAREAAAAAGWYREETATCSSSGSSTQQCPGQQHSRWLPTSASVLNLNDARKRSYVLGGMMSFSISITVFGAWQHRACTYPCVLYSCQLRSVMLCFTVNSSTCIILHFHLF